MAPAQFFVIVNDLPNAPRVAARAAHMARVLPMIERGELIRFGGAILENQPEEAKAAEDGSSPDEAFKKVAESLQFKGSAMVVVGESEEEVREKFKDDPYVKEGVWDWENARFFPIKTAISKPVAAR